MASRTTERSSERGNAVARLYRDYRPSTGNVNPPTASIIRHAGSKKAGNDSPGLAADPYSSFGGLSILYSETVMRRGLTCSRLERLKLSTPFSTRAVILSVSISGLSSNTRRKSPSPDSR